MSGTSDPHERLRSAVGKPPGDYGACRPVDRDDGLVQVTETRQRSSSGYSSDSLTNLKRSGTTREQMYNSHELCSKLACTDVTLTLSPKEAAQQRQSEAERARQTSGSLLERCAARFPCLGIMMALCASVFLGSAGMLVKLVESVNGVQVAVFRAFIQLATYGLMGCLKKGSFMPAPGEFWPVMGRAFMGAVSITCSYCALKLIPLGDATTIRFSLPIWTLIISYLVLGESCSLVKVASVLVSVLGVVLIARPDEFHHLLVLTGLAAPGTKSIQIWPPQDIETLVANRTGLQWASSDDDFQGSSENLTDLEPIDLGRQATHDPLRQFEGCLLALCSSVCLSVSIIALRMCRETPAHVTIVWLSLFSIVPCSAYLIVTSSWSMPDNLEDVAYILLNGICGSLGQWFITNALKIEQSGIVSLARTCDIQIAFLYSAFLLNERITMGSLLGSLMVSSGVVAVLLAKMLASRRT